MPQYEPRPVWLISLEEVFSWDPVSCEELKKSTRALTTRKERARRRKIGKRARNSRRINYAR